MESLFGCCIQMHMYTHIQICGHLITAKCMNRICLDIMLCLVFLKDILYSCLSSGLALAADRNFKTFQAAYNYVARKLLRDNSAAARKILYSVCIFTKLTTLMQLLNFLYCRFRYLSTCGVIISNNKFAIMCSWLVMTGTLFANNLLT